MNIEFLEYEHWREFYEHYLGPLPDENDTGWVSVNCLKHHDRHPSAGINLRSGIYNCYVCGTFSPQRFLQEILQIEDAPLPIPGAEKSDRYTTEPWPLPPEMEILLKTAQEALTPDLAIVRDYTRTHQITYETLKAFSAGYIPEGPGQLECLVFPYYLGGRLVGIKGRSFSGLKANIKGTHHVPFHIDAILDTTHQCVLVEGESDCMRAQQALGERIPVIAAPGAEFLKLWGRELESVDRVYCIPQADEASWNKFVPAVTRELGENRVRVVRLKWRRGELGKDIVDWLRPRTDQNLIDVIPWEEAKKTQGLTLSELIALGKAPVPWLVENLLARQDKGIIAAPQKNLKTFFILNLVRSALTGDDFLHWKVPHPFKVLFFEEEGTQNAFGKRVEKILGGIEDGTSMWYHLAGVKLDQDYWVNKLDQVCSEFHPDLIVFDPLQSFHNRVEDQSWEMTLVWDVIKQLIVRYNSAVIVLHHFSKGRSLTDQWDALRGSSVLAGAADLGIFLKKVRTPNPDGSLTLKMTLGARDLPTYEDTIDLTFDPTTLRISTTPEVIIHSSTVNARERLIEHLRSHGPTSFSDLVQELGVTHGRVSQIIDDLGDQIESTKTKPKIVKLSENQHGSPQV